MKHSLKSLSRFMQQPALSVGEFLLLMLVIVFFWGSVFIGLFIESIQTASAEPVTEDEQILRDFGLLPEIPPDLTPEQVEFSGAPVPIVVGVGTERRLMFEQPFRIGMEPAVSGYFDLEIYDRHLLLRAHRPVSTRARIQLASGQIIPLDIRSVTGAGPAGPLEISIVPSTPPENSDETPVVLASALPQPAKAPGYIELVRHAAQRLYAPERLWTERPGIREVPVTRENRRLIRGVRVEAKPIASWEEGGLVVTAVRIDNLEQRTIRLDPRQVLGRWRAAAFQHGRLQPDRATALYLVSDKPFEASMGIHGALAEFPSSDVSQISSNSPGVTYGVQE